VHALAGVRRLVAIRAIAAILDACLLPMLLQ
jgi:hypothetical protein